MKIYYGCILILLLASCSSTQVLNREKAEGVNLSSYKTFDFYAIGAGGDTLSEKFKDGVARVEDAIARRLQKSGYITSKTNPDLLINLGMVINAKTQTRETDFATDAPRYIGQRHYSWKSEEVPVATYREGTLTVDLVDRQSNKRVWTGTVQDILPANESRVDAAIKKGVQQLFKKFPQAGK